MDRVIMMADGGDSAHTSQPGGSGAGTVFPTTAVRYGKMNYVGEFSYPPDMEFAAGARVVMTTERGIEIGQPVSLTGWGLASSISPEQMRAYAEASNGDETYRLNSGRILREATPADLAEFRHIENTAPEKLQMCRQFAADFGLNMKIVDCEQVLGGERVIFYFMAEERVDFRQLVRRLAGEFQTRIEMRQIGARDEARLLADYETCGRQCCCRNFLKTLKPIGMAMAKLQKTTLDVAKVSGRCGRLKCCLRYEQENYEALDKKLPRTGTWVCTPHGTGQVVDRQVLTQLVKIRTEQGQLVSVAVEDILETDVAPPPIAVLDDETADEAARPPWPPAGPGPPPEPPSGDQAAFATGIPPADPTAPAPPVPETPSAADGPPGEPTPDTGGSESTPRSSRRRRGRRSRRSRHKGRGDRPSGPSRNP